MWEPDQPSSALRLQLDPLSLGIQSPAVKADLVWRAKIVGNALQHLQGILKVHPHTRHPLLVCTCMRSLTQQPVQIITISAASYRPHHQLQTSPSVQLATDTQLCYSLVSSILCGNTVACSEWVVLRVCVCVYMHVLECISMY